MSEIYGYKHQSPLNSIPNCQNSIQYCKQPPKPNHVSNSSIKIGSILQLDSCYPSNAY